MVPREPRARGDVVARQPGKTVSGLPTGRAARLPGAMGTPDNKPDKGKRIGLVSLGCPKNLVDSEVMLGELERQD